MPNQGLSSQGPPKQPNGSQCYWGLTWTPTTALPWKLPPQGPWLPRHFPLVALVRAPRHPTLCSQHQSGLLQKRWWPRAKAQALRPRVLDPLCDLGQVATPLGALLFVLENESYQLLPQTSALGIM